MKNIHVIVDYSFLFYKYTFQLMSNSIKRLTFDDGDLVRDISRLYYTTKEIEKFRDMFSNNGKDMVTVSVCFDMPSKRKEEQEKYKSNRHSIFGPADFAEIDTVKDVLSSAGYNTYRFESYEADDIIAELVTKYKDNYDYTVIVTPDTDMFVYVCGNVGVYRYKAKHGYEAIGKSKYSNYLSDELKCYVPYNSIMLFKSTCGDKSDVIKGISKFGVVAYSKYIDYLSEDKSIDFEKMCNYEYVKDVLTNSKRYLCTKNEEAVNEALSSLELVKPCAFDGGIVTEPKCEDSNDKRYEAYMKFNMKTLVSKTV